MNEELLFSLISGLTISYGVIINSKQFLTARFILTPIFIISIIFELFDLYNKSSILSYIEILGHIIFFIGQVSYGLTIIFKLNVIVPFILRKAKLMSNVEKKKATFFIILIYVLLISLIGMKVNSTLHLFNSENKFDWPYLKRIFCVILYPYRLWLAYSSYFYGFMYFLMHLSHLRLLKQLGQVKCHSYSYWYQVLVKIKNEYLLFDQLLSILPSLWILCIFFGCNSLFQVASKNIPFAIVYFMLDFVSWIFTLILVYKCHCKFVSRVEKLKSDVASSEFTDETTKSQLVILIDQISNVYVTTFSLFKLDKSFVLPFLGSLCTFTFLFRDKFSSF